MEEKANLHYLRSLEATKSLAHKVAKDMMQGGILCLYGDLGSGKTTFSKFLAEEFGLDSFKIKSPTYTYFREYKLSTDQKFYHIDLYRINDLDELMEQEMEEIFANTNNIIVIEWADRLGHILPDKRIDMKIEYIDGTTRKAKLNDRR